MLGAHARALAALARRGRLRDLTTASGIDFTSNDYLGLAGSDELRAAAMAALTGGVPLGAGGSRLLRGNHAAHEALEAQAAQHFGSEAALYFGGGFGANVAIFSCLPQRGDLIVYDALLHASGLDGIAQSKAQSVAVPHNDLTAFEDAVRAWRRAGGTGSVWIAAESLYSMDGDQAPLAELVDLADRHDAFVVVDQAHATGVAGERGQGLGHDLDRRANVVSLHTCGKALGASGALITCSSVLRDYLVNRARGFVYATAPSPVMAAVTARALEIVVSEPERRHRLTEQVALANTLIGRACGRATSGSQIIPIVVGSDARAVALADTLRRAGYDVRAIRPPTVPEGSARLRITITLNVTQAEIAGLADALGKAVAGGSSIQLGSAVPRARLHATPALPMRFVVTGTGTGVGKTVFAAALANALDADYWKPVQAGLEDGTDTQRVTALAALSPERTHAEAYRLTVPAAPVLAAQSEGITIDRERLVPPLTQRPLVIEGAGGVLVPLADDLLYADLFATWGFPVIVVASTQLGTINHTLLSLEALRARHVPVLGVAFVGTREPAVEALICRQGAVRRLGRLPWLAELCPETLRNAFAANFDLADFAPDLARVQP